MMRERGRGGEGGETEEIYRRKACVEASIRKMKEDLEKLEKERDDLDAQLDKIPGCRYVPSSPKYSPSSFQV